MGLIEYNVIRIECNYELTGAPHIEFFLRWGHLRVTVWNVVLKIWWCNK